VRKERDGGAIDMMLRGGGGEGVMKRGACRRGRKVARGGGAKWQRGPSGCWGEARRAATHAGQGSSKQAGQAGNESPDGAIPLLLLHYHVT
jgi:hypothetical protein